MSSYLKNVHVDELEIGNIKLTSTFFHKNANIPKMETLCTKTLHIFKLLNPSELVDEECYVRSNYMYKRRMDSVLVHNLSATNLINQNSVFDDVSKIIDIEKHGKDKEMKYIDSATVRIAGELVIFPLTLQANDILVCTLEFDHKCHSLAESTEIMCQETDDFVIFGERDPEDNSVQTLQSHKNYFKIENGGKNGVFNIHNKRGESITVPNITFIVPDSTKSNIIQRSLRISNDIQISTYISLETGSITLDFPNNIIQCENIQAYTDGGERMNMIRSFCIGYSTRASWKIPSSAKSDSHFIFMNIRDILNVPYNNEYNRDVFIYPSVQAKMSNTLSFGIGKNIQPISGIRSHISVDSSTSEIIMN
tara:strand:- start:477 stop:1571 length:1095 start_codon:yes stop_codon:yes gene_type:complete